MLVVSAGVALRLWFAASGRPLWLDPAMLALNVMDRTMADLIGPLDLNQAAPVGFLLLSRSVFVASGDHLGALLVVPCLAGIAALLVVAMAAWRALSPWPAVLVTAPLALGATGVYFSGEFKQYSTELLVHSLILSAVVVMGRGCRTPMQRVAVAALVVLGPLFSFTSLLALPLLLATYVGFAEGTKTRWRGELLFALGLLAYLCCFYLFILGPLRNNDLVGYHASGFPPLGFFAAARWLARNALGFCSYPLNLDWRFLAPILLFLLGTTMPGRRVESRPWRWFILAYLAATVGAALLHQYPIYTGEHDVNSRFVVQTVPAVLLLCGRGMEFLRRLNKRQVVFAAAAVLWIGALISHRVIARDPIWQDVPAAIAHLDAVGVADDCLWVYYAAVPQALIATHQHDRGFIRGVATAEADEIAFSNDLRRINHCSAAWLLISHDYSGALKKIVGAAERLGFDTTVKRFRGAEIVCCTKGTK